MKIIQKAFKKLGYAKIKPRKRNFDGAGINRLTNDFMGSNLTADELLKTGLSRLRARSRDLSINNDYAKKFLKMCSANIIGVNGIILQSKAMDGTGQNAKLDDVANKTIERAWSNWGKKGNCTVCRTLSFVDVQRITVETVARDGEIVLRKVKGFDNAHNYALQLIEPDHLDEDFNTDMLSETGNQIIMSVEVNNWGEPVAYHILTKNPNSSAGMMIGQKYTRLLAPDILHIYIKDRVQQTRGFTWLHTAITRLNMVGAYEETELIASRVASAKMGIIRTNDGYEYKGDDTDEHGNVITEAEAGMFEQLPEGWQVDMFDPKHPAGNFDPFMKAILRGISSGLNVAYNTLANDLQGVNFSSIRSGVLEEREQWKMLQGFFVNHLINPIFTDWLTVQLIYQNIKLPLAKFDKFNSPKWQTRGWSWVDPMKDVKANNEAIAQNTKTRTAVVAEGGRDLQDVFEEIQREKKLAEKYGINLAPPVKEAPPANNNDAGTKIDDDEFEERVLEIINNNNGGLK